MQFLFHGKPTAETQANPPADLMDTVRGDWAMARAYYGRGIFRQMWMAGYGVIAICEADTREQLEIWLDDLPMAKAGLIEREVIELAPYPGFVPEPTSS